MQIEVSYFRPSLGEKEIEEVIATLRSGWLTTGPRVNRFEREFAEAVGGKYAVAVNSCTAALHLAVEALQLKAGDAVLVPTMTFAATAEIVRYRDAIPVLVDCDPVTTNMDLDDAAVKLTQLSKGKLLKKLPQDLMAVGMIPVHVGGMMMDIDALGRFADNHHLWIVEDAAHAFPSAWRRSFDHSWQRCGEGTAQVSCFSFYANKTITTGEGGMAVTDNREIADRMRLMSLHGLSHDAWGRYSGNGNWDYKIKAPGFKYNLTDIAAAIGIHQLARAEEMRLEREKIAVRYIEALEDVEEVELPFVDIDRKHSWHLFPIRLRTLQLAIDRDEFMRKMKAGGINCSMHWRPLHLHPYYQHTFGWRPDQFPVASALWKRSLSLPIFSGMTEQEVEYVIRTIKRLCRQHARRKLIARPVDNAAIQPVTACWPDQINAK